MSELREEILSPSQAASCLSDTVATEEPAKECNLPYRESPEEEALTIKNNGAGKHDHTGNRSDAGKEQLLASSSASGLEFEPLTIMNIGGIVNSSAFGPYVASAVMVVPLLALSASSDLDNWSLFAEITCGLMLFSYVMCWLASRTRLQKGRWSDLSITLNSQGLTWHTFKSFPRITKPWSQLRYVGFQRGMLVLDCVNGEDYCINLDRFKPAQRARLFQIISRFVRPEVLSPEVLFLQVQSLCGVASASLDDFTTIWLEEFSSRFELANHVTLPAGSCVGNGRFSIAMTIATTINSSTYLAFDKSGHKCVIKELVAPIDSEDAARKKMLEQFNREAAFLSRLEHPNVVKIFDHFVENGRSYIVMECVVGKNLREFVRSQGTFKEPDLIQIAIQLLSVLQYLHDQEPPILHRDFTPDNIVYSLADCAITVIDFGAANVYATKGTATLIGKQSYMPPEQFQGKPSPASDIYAFGATLYFLMFGDDPPGMGRISLTNKEGVSDQLATLIESCTSFEQIHRPSIDAILDTLKEVQDKAVASGQNK